MEASPIKQEGSGSSHGGVTIDSIYYYGKSVYQDVNLRSYFESMVTPPWEEPLPSCFIGEASIHQRRLKVLSEPCWIVTHHTALKPNL
ncbi:unnamed protein product [Cuscuta campestris]|uniref:Uncharacterized protein n=1 Tax=Cuscuta campestris TaxID=132261 RepID=A0A484NFC9_9ASTE|nr:unnamed protein product [Cuscuta campestris]